MDSNSHLHTRIGSIEVHMDAWVICRLDIPWSRIGLPSDQSILSHSDYVGKWRLFIFISYITIIVISKSALLRCWLSNCDQRTPPKPGNTKKHRKHYLCSYHCLASPIWWYGLDQRTVSAAKCLMCWERFSFRHR